MWRDSKWFFLEKDHQGDEYVRPAGDEVLIVALTPSGDVILSREPSPAFGESVLILPGGSVEDTETHETTANRELQEEIGYKAGRLDFLGEIRPWAKYLQLRSFVYLARDLTVSQLDGDEGYEIGVVRVPLAEFEERISAGELRDARTIAALYMTRRLLARRQSTS